MWEYKATIVRHIDADTCEALVDLGFYIYTRHRLRLMGSAGGVDAPELNSPDPATRARALASRARVNVLAPPGSPVILRTERPQAGDRLDGFGRFLTQIILPDGRNVGDVLLAEGLAVPYVRR